MSARTRMVPPSELKPGSLCAEDYMDKYGVDESQNEDMDKKASEGCPKCGAAPQRHGNTLLCPNCGSEPFEK